MRYSSVKLLYVSSGLRNEFNKKIVMIGQHRISRKKTHPKGLNDIFMKTVILHSTCKHLFYIHDHNLFSYYQCSFHQNTIMIRIDS